MAELGWGSVIRDTLLSAEGLAAPQLCANSPWDSGQVTASHVPLGVSWPHLQNERLGPGCLMSPLWLKASIRSLGYLGNEILSRRRMRLRTVAMEGLRREGGLGAPS